MTDDRRYGIVGNAGFKLPARAATTAALVLSGEQTVDGVALVTGDRCLVKNQASSVNNGVYIVDTGAWVRAADFDGPYDIVEGSLIRVNEGSANAAAQYSVATVDPITIGSSALTFTREAINYVARDSQVAGAGQTVFNLGATYLLGANEVAAYVNGIRQRIVADFNETTPTRITFTYGLIAGDEVDFYIGQALGALVAAAAGTIAVADAGGYFVGTTVESVLQELADPVVPDVGDADAVLVNGTDNNIQRWNTVLTANHTVTLSTASAREGAHFVIVRGAGATGNYTLAVGALATLRAPGEWAEVRYDAGTASWLLEKYGILPSAELLGMSADNGDAAVNLTVGSSLRTQRWATPLTADRTATLVAGGAYNGARFRITRLDAATGNYALVVATATATLARLAVGQFCDVEYTGTAWLVTAIGNLRAVNPNLVALYDDFLGQEIDGHRWQSLIGTDAGCLQAVVLADQPAGVVRLTTGANAGATMALNGCQLHCGLNWKASRGCLTWEGSVALSAITNVALYVGLTDQVAALEMPFTLAAGDALTSNASDAVGVLFDTAADTDNWWLVGVAADIDAVKQNTALAPVAGVFETWRIELSASGSASFYRNGTLIGVVMAAAVTAGAQLTPVIAAFSRGAASRNIDSDYILTNMQR